MKIIGCFCAFVLALIVWSQAGMLAGLGIFFFLLIAMAVLEEWE